MSRPFLGSVAIAISVMAAGSVDGREAASKCMAPTGLLARGSAFGVGWVQFSEYKPREIQHLADLPSGIRARLQQHLIERLGERLYRRFSFSGGQIVDWRAFRRAEPHPAYEWKVFTYNLMFTLTAPEVGIDRYSAAIELDANGDIIKMIGFPPARRLPLKAEFFPLARAYALACIRGFDLKRVSAELDYDSDIESVIYRLREVFKSKYGGGRDRVLEMDAHSGRFLHVNWQTWYD